MNMNAKIASTLIKLVLRDAKGNIEGMSTELVRSFGLQEFKTITVLNLDGSTASVTQKIKYKGEKQWRLLSIQG